MADSPYPTPHLGRVGDEVALTGGGRVAVVAPDGTAGTIPESELPRALAVGYKLEGHAQYQERRADQLYGDAPVTAGLEGAARGLTFGISDTLLEPLVGEGLRERRNRNRVAAGIGEAAAMLAPTGAGSLIGKAGLAAGERIAGTALVEGLAGGGLASRAVAKAAQYGAQAATEGALMGAQQTVTEVSLSQDPMNAEAIAAALGSNMLYGGLAGGAAGGALGGLGTVAKGAAQRLRSATTKWADREAALAAVPQDIAQMDAKAARAALGEEKATLRAAKDTEFKTLRAERDAEIEALKTGQKVEREAAAKEALTFREDLRHVGDDLPGLLKKNGLEGAGLLKGQDGLFSAQKQFARIVDSIPERPLAGVSALRTLERSARNVTAAFDEAGIAGLPQIERLGTMADQAAALRSRLEAAAAAPTSAKLADLETKLAGFDKSVLASERMTALEGHLDNLANPSTGRQLLGVLGDKATGMGAGAALGMMGLGGGPLGALAGAGVGWGLGVLKKRMAATAGGWPKLISEGIDKAVSGAVVAAPTVARSVAIGASFGARAARGQSVEGRALDVLDAVGDMDATRSQVREGLAGIRAADPDLAQQIEDQALRRLDYLAKVAPRNPGMGGLAGGEDRWRPADAELAKFARAVATSEQPLRILDELASDTLTPQTVECVKAVYPEMFKRLSVELLDKLVEPGRKPLSPARHLNLTMLTGTPTDSRLKPEFVLRQQQAWEQMRQEMEQARQRQKPPPPQPPTQAQRAMTDLAPTASQTPI